MTINKSKLREHLLLGPVIALSSLTACTDKSNANPGMDQVQHFKFDNQIISYSALIDKEHEPLVIAYRVAVTSEENFPIDLAGSLEFRLSKNNESEYLILGNGSTQVSSGSIGVCIIPYNDQGVISLAIGFGSGVAGKRLLSNFKTTETPIHSKESLNSMFVDSESLHLIFLEDEII